MFIAAAPEDIWRVLIDTRDIRPGEVADAWMYRIGVPTPSAGVGDFRDGEHLRHITMGEGRPLRPGGHGLAREPARHLALSVRRMIRSRPALSMITCASGASTSTSRECTYSLTPVAGGTRLAIRMNYRVSTHFNWYAAPVADWLVGDFAEVILDFYARRASATAPQAGSS